MNFLVDYNLDGYAAVLLGILTKRGWLEFFSIQFVTYRETGLPMNSSGQLCCAEGNVLCGITLKQIK